MGSGSGLLLTRACGNKKVAVGFEAMYGHVEEKDMNDGIHLRGLLAVTTFLMLLVLCMSDTLGYEHSSLMIHVRSNWLNTDSHMHVPPDMC